MPSARDLLPGFETDFTEDIDDDVYEAEKILRRKSHNGNVYYLVKWKGWDQSTWELEDDLECVNLIKEYTLLLVHDTHDAPLRNGNCTARSKRPVWSSDCGKERIGGVKVNNHQLDHSRVHTPDVKIQAQCVRSADAMSSKAKLVHVGGAPFTCHPKVSHRPRQLHILHGEEEMLLFHGTRRSFADSICISGFKLPQARSGHGIGAVRPHMFGKGVYFTTSREKASHFGDTIMVCRVKVGIRHMPNEAELELDGEKLWNTYKCDSVHAVAGCGGNVFDEFVVFDPSQATVVGYL